MQFAVQCIALTSAVCLSAHVTYLGTDTHCWLVHVPLSKLFGIVYHYAKRVCMMQNRPEGSWSASQSS